MDDPRGGPHDSGRLPYPAAAVGDDEISLRPLFRTLWGYRRVIAASVGAVFIGVLFWALASYVYQPTEQRASLEFRLIFDGADQGEYPNGLVFSLAEIIGTPVLTEVYAANELERYHTYDEFKSGIFILEASPDMELLGFEYQAKLADSRLGPVDRSILEEEFHRKREALHVSQYSLNFVKPGSVTSIPNVLMSKVLNDILVEWAEQAAARRGALTYQLRMYTSSLPLKEFLEADDDIVRVDILRRKVNRFLGNLVALDALPGVSVLRVGENRISLPEIHAKMEDLLRFRLGPLAAYIATHTPPRERDRLRPYLENRQFEIALDLQKAEGRGRVLDDSLRSYLARKGTFWTGVEGGGGGSATAAPSAGPSALIPQFGDSFLGRVMDLAGETDDVPYRQDLTDRIIAANLATVNLARESAYYERLNELVEKAWSSSDRGSPDSEVTRDVEAEFSEIHTAVVQAMEQANAVYMELSSQNLNPRTNLFTITSPFLVTSERAVTLLALAPSVMLVLMASLILVPLSCLVHHYFRREILPVRPARQPDVPQQEQPKERVERAFGP